MKIFPVRRNKTFLAARGLTFILFGCASPSLNKNQCLSGDWFSIGITDGRLGFSPARIADHADACEELGIVPKASEYRAGWNEGVRGFCTFAQGVRRGRDGDPYHGLCPPDLEPGFLSGYDQGLQDFCAPSRGFEAGRSDNSYQGNVCPPGLEIGYHRAYEYGLSIHRARERIESIERQRNKLEHQLAHAKTDKERRQIADQLKHLRGDHHQAINSMFFLENSFPWR